MLFIDIVYFLWRWKQWRQFDDVASGQGAGEKHGRFISRNGNVGGGVDHDDGSYDWVKDV